jgi:hypothetical protein
MGTTTRLILPELSDGRRVPIREALSYGARHLATFALSPLALLLGVGLVLLLEVAFLFVGRIDYLGELIVSLAFLPLVVLNLFVLLVASFGVMLTFPLVADQGGGIGATLVSVLKIVRRAPGRLVIYMTVAGLAAFLFLMFWAYLVVGSLYVTLGFLAVGMGSKLAILAAGVPFDLGLFPGLSSQPWGWLLGAEQPATFGVARFVLAISLLVLVLAVMILPQVFYLASTCAAYILLCGGCVCAYCGAPLEGQGDYCPQCGHRQP